MQFSIQILIRTFVRVKKLVWIYSDIHLCNFVDTNIFGHSFVSKFSRMSHSGLDLAVWYYSWIGRRQCYLVLPLVEDPDLSSSAAAALPQLCHPAWLGSPAPLFKSRIRITFVESSTKASQKTRFLNSCHPAQFSCPKTHHCKCYIATLPPDQIQPRPSVRNSPTKIRIRFYSYLHVGLNLVLIWKLSS